MKRNFEGPKKAQSIPRLYFLGSRLLRAKNTCRYNQLWKVLELEDNFTYSNIPGYRLGWEKELVPCSKYRTDRTRIKHVCRLPVKIYVGLREAENWYLPGLCCWSWRYDCD